MKLNKTLIVLLILSLFPLVGFFHAGLPITHDGPDHVARIANFYQSLSEGNVIPRWAGNLNWGYGHPILMFLYPLPSYIASFFRLVGFSFVDSTKMVFGVSFIASTCAMYFWASKRWGSMKGILIALLYGFAPYRFVDMYVRGAIGEHVAFVFPPLIFYCIDALSLVWTQNRKKLKDIVVGIRPGIYLSVSIAGLILAHNAISLMFMPIIVLYILYIFLYETKNRTLFIIHCSLFIGLGLLISAFFWIPALIEGKYTLRDIVTKGETITRFVPFMMFIYSPWNYGGGNEFTKSIGTIEWLGSVSVLFVLLKEKSINICIFIGGTLALFMVSLFLQTNASLGIWNAVPVMQKFQFPWRFLTVSVFLSSILSGWTIGWLIEKYGKKKTMPLTIVIGACIVISTYYMWFPKGFSEIPDSDAHYSGVYTGTTDTGESSPIWSVRFMEHFPSSMMTLDKGEASVQTIKRTSTEHLYKVTATGSARLVENTLYFPGWKITVDGKKADIQYQDPLYRGLMVFSVDDGAHDVKIVFGKTKLREYSEVLSIVGGMILLGMTGIVLWKTKK